MADKNTFFEIGRSALTGMIDALEKNQSLTRREVEMPDPPQVVTADEMVRLRVGTFRVSQHVFARMLNVAPKTVQSWEQGRNRPTGATLRFIRVIQRYPGVLLYETRIKPSFRSGKSTKARKTAG